MPISKRLRFDTFKRDHFTCQYCGRTPPVVILEADHVIPLSRGGDDAQSNLITACFDCNRGKSANELSQIPKSLAELIEEKTKIAEQVKAFNRFLKAQRKKEENDIEELGRYWYELLRKKNYTFGPGRIPTIKTFLRNLPREEIADAISIAFGRIVPADKNDDFRTFKYFCGICWKKIKRMEENATNTTDQA